ncbi:MAG: tRNA (N6-isopentenyl adenosine(37)-C2)-methylthiotransferase MiaB [Candidatus Magnetoovum sp. WYHC-5]|nr:tRNA (N6-isopentenyl adenosine(37)-C2)-methylthiotransferase MiaB [Candidatus Magnetoovum sp. WYHC-5]
MENRKLAYINTWGCQMNAHDTEKMKGLLSLVGYDFTDKQEEADLILFNTCSIRQKAEQKFYSTLGMMKALKQKKPHIKIGVTGCIAQQEGDNIHKAFPFVDFTVGPQNISMLTDALEYDSYVSLITENKQLHTNNLPAIRSDQRRAWVNIMYGCNNFCTYCVVPYVRGRESSRPYGSILAEIGQLAEANYQEVTLLGQNVNSYNGGCPFHTLLEEIQKIDRLKRIRFVTSHPKDLNDELINTMATHNKICKHIHLPLQSGSSRVLKLMNRKYTFAEYIDKVNRLRLKIPDMAITSDIIAGFPTETTADHKETVRALTEIRFDGIFAFKYSNRPFTKASQMEGQVDELVKSERLKEILELQDNISEEINKRMEGGTYAVLIEECTDTTQNLYSGRTQTNKIINFNSPRQLAVGDIVDVKILNGYRHSLDGCIVNT